MKDSITQQFPRVPIKDVAIINPRRFDIPISDDESLSFVPMKDVEEETGRLHTKVVKVWKEVKKGYTPFQEGDVIFAKITPCMENGKFALAMGLHGGRAAGSTEFHVFRPKPIVDPKYLLYYFFTPAIRHAAKANMKGTAGQLRVPIAFLEEQEIPLPSIEDQRSIVSEIEKQFTRLDAGVAALKRVQANLKRYRAAVLKAACEGKLVPTEAELARKEGRDYEPASVLLERILKERREKWQEQYPKKKYVEPKGPDTSNLPELPEGWCWATVEQLSSFEKYSLAIGPFGSNLKVSDYTNSGVPLVFVKNIRYKAFNDFIKFVSHDKAKNLSQHQIQGGDVLVTKMGEPPGEACLYPEDCPVAIITADCIKLRLMKMGISKQYCIHSLNSVKVKSQILKITKGVAQQKVSLERFSKISIPLPPFREQLHVTEEIERRFSVDDQVNVLLNLNLKRLSCLRQAILRCAFE